MQKILIIGNCGAGKTCFAIQLAKKLGLPVVHLDSLFWLPDWVQRERDDFDKLLQTELEKPRWLMDGNYNRTLPLRLQYADTVIHLNYNRWICLYRVIRRSFLKEEHAQGCQSKIDLSFLWYVFYKYPQYNRFSSMALQGQFPSLEWIEIRSPFEAKNFLDKKLIPD